MYRFFDSDQEGWYSGNSSGSRSGYQLSREILVIFLSQSKQISKPYIEIGHGRLLPNSFLRSIHYKSPTFDATVARLNIFAQLLSSSFNQTLYQYRPLHHSLTIQTRLLESQKHNAHLPAPGRQNSHVVTCLQLFSVLTARTTRSKLQVYSPSPNHRLPLLHHVTRSKEGRT